MRGPTVGNGVTAVVLPARRRCACAGLRWGRRDGGGFACPAALRLRGPTVGEGVTAVV
ncbi:hypothetical protein [Superficieibacter sp. 1612_C1]|uniref:hypothetical protein n=1 Tax=Superficieibacter sp. 1612_C1 TaxID=2780382 RepID=UPI001883B3FB|nr:hypothetical protein [Superficieibacter sp. 1612_C1]